MANSDVADELGLGSKMIESLAFWLKVTGLARDGGATRGRVPTELAVLVSERDPFCELPGTWWFLHLQLATTPGSVWHWFFNVYSDRMFDRNACADAFLEHTRSRALRPASPAVAQRDVACLLSAYACRPGVDFVEPEDPAACPFRELGLIWKHDHVGRYERTRLPTGLPGEALLACVAMLAQESGRDTFSLRELANIKDGPGRVFCAGLDALEQVVASATADSPHARAGSLAGDRVLVIEPRPIHAWMKDFYDRMGAAA
jgi:hypothetical protein